MITVEKNYKDNTLFMKRDGKMLSGVHIDSGEPSSKFFWYPHVGELFRYIPKRILCIGGGACVYPSYVTQKNPNAVVDVVELDPVVVRAAMQFFPIAKSARCRVTVGDGYGFLQTVRPSTYDFIFVDVGIIVDFAEESKNIKFLSGDALKLYSRALATKGSLMVNIIMPASPAHVRAIRMKLLRYIKAFATSMAFRITQDWPPDRIQDVVFLFSRQRTSASSMAKRLHLISRRRLSYPKNHYANVLKTEIAFR